MSFCFLLFFPFSFHFSSSFLLYYFASPILYSYFLSLTSALSYSFSPPLFLSSYFFSFLLLSCSLSSFLVLSILSREAAIFFCGCFHCCRGPMSFFILFLVMLCFVLFYQHLHNNQPERRSNTLMGQ